MQVKHNGTDNIDAMKLKNAGIGEGTAQTSAQAQKARVLAAELRASRLFGTDTDGKRF